MKKIRTFLPVMIAVIIFMLAQSIIVRQIWTQKDEVFKLRYRSVSQEVIEDMMIKEGESGFNKAYYTIDYIIPTSYLEKSKFLFTTGDTAVFRKRILENITAILTEDEVLSEHLGSSFEKLGLEKKLKHKIYVNDLYLIDHNYNFHIHKATVVELKEQHRQGNVLVNTFFSEGNNYKISFDYYIDITNKEKIILRELALTLMLSLISLLILSIIFIATLRNYLEEKRLSSLKTDFINNMTHELKTPLSTITVAGKTLKLNEILNDKEKILETANLIGKQSVHLNKLINLILEISMWERTQFQIEKNETDLEELLRDIADGFRNGCGKDCNFTDGYDLNGVKANVDIIYFTTMINNLLHNAVKYSKGSPEVKLEASNTNGVTIKISDKGIGISKSDQKHIFEKFYRVSTGNIHKTKGLGLGLYYVKKIAEAHGGDVSVSSKPGKGSVFIISIP
ncbi:MAG TPA: HAMP domain-containing sensor histidine kinase [Bacteroidales bacterium]|nr:HAMP domain-containing sensor histidine kinase [Bacteroidales bacterium]